MTPRSTGSRPSPKTALMKGAAWTVGLRWSIKAIGLINTIVMARILMPSDYGIVSMAFLVLGLTQALLDFGATTALLRKNEVSPQEINSAWSLKIIQGVIAGLILVVLSPFAASYFGEPRVTPVLWVLAACVAIGSAGSMGPTLAQKQFDYSLDFKLQIAQAVIRVIVTLIAGLLLRDYRALVIGIVAAYAVPLALSYALHPYRPRWDISRIPEIWAVTRWLMFAGIGTYILRKSDELIAGRIGTTEEYGQFAVGADIGQLPVGEVGPAMLRALLPVLASIQADAERTRKAVVKTISALNTVIWPIGLGFAAIAHPATILLLGEKWSDAAAFIGTYAVASVLQTAVSPLYTLLIVQGHTRTRMHIVWAEFAAFVCLAMVLVPNMHLIGLVYARIIASLVNLAVTTALTKAYCSFPLAPLISATGRPFLGAAIMYLAVRYAITFVAGNAVQTVVGILTGITFYILWSLTTWHLAGRPEGLESTASDFLAGFYKK